MEKFETFTGKAVPLDVPNCDTDQIMPKQFLKRVERTGFDEFAFWNWRRQPDGSVNENFVLSKPRYQGAQVLIAGENFGCGSSREHAPWALIQYGFKVIIAPSFADIFTNNAFNNGILLVSLGADQVEQWMRRTEASEGYTVTVDLAAQTLTGSDGYACGFEVDPFRKKRLLEGLDNIGLTLVHSDAITAYEQSHPKPWQAAVSQ